MVGLSNYSKGAETFRDSQDREGRQKAGVFDSVIL
jgi:hypothetical protein